MPARQNEAEGRPDPAAALADALYGGHNLLEYMFDAKVIYARLQRSGYVLVNADMLARAMGDVTGEDEDGSWAWCPAAILVALQADREATRG